MVDDPSSWPDLFKDEKAQEKERQRLFRIIEDLVKWENTTNEEVLQKARDEIWRSWRRACAENVAHPQAQELFDREKLPAFHDPFAGGGALPLEAQRLGLEAYASDLNPVAVLINKAMIEIPPKFAGMPPVHPETSQTRTEWNGPAGLAEDVRFYGQWMRDQAEKRIGHLYPKVKVTAEMVTERPDLALYLGKELTVIAWIWARTVKSPNPAFRDVEIPLANTFMLSTKPGKEAYVEPVVTGSEYRFRVILGKPHNVDQVNNGLKIGRGAHFSCLLSGTPIDAEYIRTESKAHRLGARMLGVVAEGSRGRIYLSPTPEMEAAAKAATPRWQPDVDFFQQALGFRVGNYGMTRWSDLFTARQLTALSTFSELVAEARKLALQHAQNARLEPEIGLEYADAIATYLSFSVSRLANRQASICVWNRISEVIEQVFKLQAIPMTWDFPEGNVFSDSTGGWSGSLEWIPTALETLPITRAGHAVQQNASTQSVSRSKVVSTDPPYFDNVGYADLSDFFYVWLRHSLKHVYPTLFATVATPKDEELVATPDRHGGRGRAEKFFLTGMKEAMSRLADYGHAAFPITIYYAFKQAETDRKGGSTSTGWETFLEAVIQSGFAITGTWPIKTERGGGVRTLDRNALASSIILVCRKRGQSASEATRREFLRALETELPSSITDLQRGNVAPVDLQQAAIGPGMAIFTRYSRVLNANGQQLTVREALALINQALDEVLAHQEGDFDSDTRWAISWFEQYGFAEGDYGVAEILSKAKNTSVEGIREAGIGTHGKGRVRLFKPEELPQNWTPESDSRLTVWDMVHHLIKSLEQGEQVAGRLLAKLGSNAETARELAYRLYSICERKKRSADALRYNALVQSWPELLRLAQAPSEAKSEPQTTLQFE